MKPPETLPANDHALLAIADDAAKAASTYLEAATGAMSGLLDRDGRLPGAKLISEQRALHGLAWIATVVEVLGTAVASARDKLNRQMLTEADRLTLKIGFGEYLAQLCSGITMSQCEIVRPSDIGAENAATTLAGNASVRALVRAGSTTETRARLAAILGEDGLPDPVSGDETLDIIRSQFRRFVQSEIVPNAHAWHLDDALIPDAVIGRLAEMGTFGICIDPEYGGLGLGKLEMCVVTEELSRGWVAAGSLGTRSEIAGDLILSSGTDAQKRQWLPGIASGKVLPAAVFTEPDVGSDLGQIGTRAVRDPAGGWKISGNKTWITHAARSDLMTVLARTEQGVSGYRGVSILLAPKPRADAGMAFPAEGMSGTDIPVLGYRGMREYELSFENFPVPEGSVLGDRTGDGFRQLMQTFEGARIQTAARAVGVALNALELGLRYAGDRHQFGRKLSEFPRVSDKLALMYVETSLVRELTYHAARRKDGGARCDIEAGMAKLLAARVAWSNADCALQIHGGNGFALEYEISRLLCDARVLNIFEGSAEIQAQVIAKGLLTRREGLTRKAS